MHKVTAIPNRPPVPIIKDYNQNDFKLLIECMDDLNKLILYQNLTAKTLAIEPLKFSTEPEVDRLIHLLFKLNTETLIIFSEGDYLFDTFESQQYFFDQLEEKNKALIIRENSSLWPQPEKRPPIEIDWHDMELGSFLLVCIIKLLISNLLNSSDNENSVPPFNATIPPY